MAIKGIEGMSGSALAVEMQRGGRFVVFPYCVSIVILTFKRSSGVYFIRAGESAAAKGLIFSLTSLLFGWWGIPWGPIYTIQSLVVNFKGGRDVTQQVLAAIEKRQQSA